MTSPLNLSAAKFIPSVRYDSNSGERIFEGESYPEDGATFDGPIRKWVHGAMREQIPGEAENVWRYRSGSGDQVRSRHRTGRGFELPYLLEAVE